MGEKKVDTVMRYSPLDIPRIVRAHWNAVPKEPVHFIGEPSTVKSASVFQEAKALAEGKQKKFFEWNRATLEEKKAIMNDPSGHFIFADLRASETDIGELRLQDLKAGESFITFKYNILFDAMSKPSAEGILFFDEMNLAPNMIKAQFYKIINDRAVGDIPIADGILCISAGNEAEHARGVTEDPVPLVLRRGNYFVRPLTPEEYTDYAVKTGHHEWVIGYLGFQPQDVHKVEYELPDSVGQPCARTWTKMSNILKHNTSMPAEDVEMIATGLLGQGIARKFGAYVRSAKSINLAEIIAKPELIKKYEDNEELSLLYAIISGVVEKFRGEPKIIKPAFEMSLHLTKVEFGSYLLRSLKNIDKKQFMKAGGSSLDKVLVDKVIDRYAKFIFKDADVEAS
jgi:hypothetical protein